jgi:hypothetical protein
MAVIVSKSSGLNDDLWNEWSDQLIAVIQDTDTEKSDADDFVNSVFNVKKSNKFGEKASSLTEFANFEVVPEGQNAVQDDLQEGFSKLIEHKAFMKSFILTAEMAEDSQVDMMKAKAANFVKAYKRSRAQYASDALTAQAATFNYGTATAGQGLDATGADNKALFAIDHPSIKGSLTQSNVFTNAFGSDATMLNRLANIGRNFKNSSEITMGYTFDTIIIPSNCYALEDTIKKIIKTDLMVGSNLNDVNTQKGLWKLIVDPFWQVSGSEQPYILMSSAANKELIANQFYDRIPLTVKDDVDIQTHNYVWSGRARFSAGFSAWQHVILGGASTGTTLQ